MKIKPTKICKRKGCNKEFRIFKTTDKYCSASCAYADQEKKPKKNAFIKPVSEKRKAESLLYSKKRKTFLALTENKFCPVIKAVFEGTIDSSYFQQHELNLINKSKGFFLTDSVHHKAGRRGKFLNYVPLWLAVSDLGHRWIHANPKEAYMLDFLHKNSTINI